jgi:DNA-binding FrmR family transcriptional regulator
MLANPRQVLAILQFVAATQIFVGKLKKQIANSDLNHCSNRPKSYLKRFPTMENIKSLKIEKV